MTVNRVGRQRAVFNQRVTSTGVTNLNRNILPGLYRITVLGQSFADTNFRFRDSSNRLYGVTITNGIGVISIPFTVNAINVTSATVPFNLLIEELTDYGPILPPPIVSSWSWTGALTGSESGTVTWSSPGPVSATGFFNINTGAFTILSSNTSPISGVQPLANITAGQSADFVFVVADANGIFSAGTLVNTGPYPFYVFITSGTYTPPSGSTSADVLIVAGGGSGGTGGNSAGGTGGGGGGGGTRLVSAVSTPGNVTVTIGAGGAAPGSIPGVGSSGGATSFGAQTTVGGGRGGGTGGGPLTGGSGGGGGGPSGTGSAGTTGQGFAGGNGSGTGTGVGGGGGGAGGAGGNTGDRGIAAVIFGYSVAEGGPGGNSPVGGTGNGVPSNLYGGGGGGGGSGGSSRNGAAGTSGIVVVKALF